MTQALAVYSVVAVAALYIGWKFMPAALRRWFVPRIGALMRSCGIAGSRVAWLESKAESGGACGSCNSCDVSGTNRSNLRT